MSSLDVMATAFAAAGLPPPAPDRHDSINLRPFPRGENRDPPHPRLFWRSGAKKAAREGDWKLVRQAGQADELYDLARDTGETRDLAASEPAIARRLAAALDAWDQQLLPPAFEGPQRKRAAKK